MTCLPARTAIVGFEDLFGPSDRDFNDIQIAVTGVDFHLASDFVFTPPAGYNETPFPDGYLFDFGTVTGGVMATQYGRQSAYFDVAMLKVGDGPWLDVPLAGSLSITAPIGTKVLFGVRTPYETFDSDPELNADGLYHAVVTGVPGGEAPEPGPLVLITLGVVGILLLGGNETTRSLRARQRVIEKAESCVSERTDRSMVRGRGQTEYYALSFHG
jgi:hypothetical protein